MRSVSRDGILLSFLNGSEGERTAVIVLDAVKANRVESTRSPTWR